MTSLLKLIYDGVTQRENVNELNCLTIKCTSFRGRLSGIWRRLIVCACLYRISLILYLAMCVRLCVSVCVFMWERDEIKACINHTDLTCASACEILHKTVDRLLPSCILRQRSWMLCSCRFSCILSNLNSNWVLTLKNIILQSQK